MGTYVNSAFAPIGVSSPDQSFHLIVQRFMLLSDLATCERDDVQAKLLEATRHVEAAQFQNIDLISESGACRNALLAFLRALREEDVFALATLVTAASEGVEAPLEHWVQIRAIYCYRQSAEQYLLDKGSASECLRTAVTSISSIEALDRLPAQIRALNHLYQRLGEARNPN